MLRSLSRTWIVAIAFLLGMAMSFMIVGVVVFVVSTNYTIRDIEEKTAIPTISEQYIGEYPEVYIRDMTLVEMLKEGKELADMGDALTLNLLISRYDLILPDKADVFLTDDIRDLPLKDVFSENGVDVILNTVHVAEFRGYEQREIDGELVWYDPKKDVPIKGINRITADLTLAETLSSDFNFISLLDDLTIGEALGYEHVGDVYYHNGKEVTGVMGVVCKSYINDLSETFEGTELADIFGYEERDGAYYDSNGEKVTGVMAIVCDASIHNIPERINNAMFAEILGYELGEDGYYYDNGEKVTGVMDVIAEATVISAPDEIENANMGEIFGYTYNSESETWFDSSGQQVHVLLNKISGKKITELGTITDELVLSDVINEVDRDGLVSFIPEDTPLDDIPDAVDEAFNEHSLRDFIEADIIQFTDSETETAEEKKEKFLQKSFADYSIPQVIDYLYKLP